MDPDILNLSPTTKLWGYSSFTVATLLVLDTVAVDVGNHSVSSRKKSEAAADVTLLYNLTPRTKLSPDGLAVGKLVIVTV